MGKIAIPPLPNHDVATWRLRVSSEMDVAGRLALQTLHNSKRPMTTASDLSRLSAASLYRTSSSNSFPAGNLLQSTSALHDSASSRVMLSSLAQEDPPSFGRSFGGSPWLTSDSNFATMSRTRSSTVSVENFWPGQRVSRGVPLRPSLRSAVHDQAGEGYKWMAGTWRRLPQTSPRNVPMAA